MNNKIRRLLFERGTDIVRFVDISHMAAKQTQGFTKAIVFCMALSKDYIMAMNNEEKTEKNEFLDKEHETDALADYLSQYLLRKGYSAYSQSEESHWQNGNFDLTIRSSKLPHKTIGRLAGIGYIGKNNLLISKEYGCGFSMCSVLTDAPITTEIHSLVASKCGGCDICRQVCSEKAVLGNEWSESTGREGILDASKCTCGLLKCMVNCPHTLKYATQAD